MHKARHAAAATDGPAHPLPASTMRCWQNQCRSFTALELRDKTSVFRQDEWCRHIYYLAHGYMKCTVTDRHGHEFIRSILREGDFFGVTSGQPRQHMPEATITKGQVRLYRCEAAEFIALLETEPGIARYLLTNLSERLAFAHRQTEMVLYQSIVARIALTLCEFAGRYGGRCRHGHEVDIRLTQQELADVVGASRPVVSTVLNDLRQRQVVSYTRTFICIESMASLERLLDY